MGKYMNLMPLVLLGGFAMGLTACNGGDPEVDGTCDPALDGDPDCIEDGNCNTDDPNDPDCDFCDYPENEDDEECKEEPPPPDYFEPWLVDVDGSFSFDPAKGEVTNYVFDGEDIPTSIDILIYDQRFQSTQNIAFLCGLQLVPKSGTEKAVFNEFSADLGSGDKSYKHYGYTMKGADIELVNMPIPTQSGNIAGCLDIEADPQRGFDPAIWGDDFGALFTAQDWGMYVGDIADEVADEVGDAENDDPANDYDLYSLYGSGYVIGGSQQASEYVETNVFWYSYGFALDDKFELVPTGNEDDEFQRIIGADMYPVVDEGGNITQPAARGVYFIRSVLYAWQAKPLLLGIAQ